MTEYESEIAELLQVRRELRTAEIAAEYVIDKVVSDHIPITLDLMQDGIKFAEDQIKQAQELNNDNT